MVVLLMIVTLGVYGWIWSWKTAAETDAFRPHQRAFQLMRPGVLLEIGGAVLALLAALLIIGTIAAAVSADGIDPQVLVGGAFGAILLVILAVLIGLVGSVLVYIALWRVWDGLRQEQIQLRHPPVQPAVLLLLVLAPLGASFIGMPFALIPFFGMLMQLALTVASVVAYYVAIWITQDRLNRVWAGHGGGGPGRPVTAPQAA